MRNNMKEWPTVEAFEGWCKTKFGDPNEKITKRQELYNLKQKKTDFTTFIGDFLNIASRTDMDEGTKISVLEQNMCWDLQSAMLHHEVPETMDKFVELLHKLDHRLAKYKRAFGTVLDN